ncbi:MAG: response regulator, partial [Acidobacteria bacterium]|nr:response regulator [Acidobacteriota bacterium]
LGRIRPRILENGLATLREVEGLSEELVLDHIFAPGFSTTSEVSEISGRGVGLDVVQSVLREVGGSVHVSSVPGAGATFHLRVPVSRSVIRAVVVRIAGEPYAFPLLRIDRLLRVPVSEVHLAEDRQFVVVEGRNVALVPADQVLELSGGAVPPGDVPVVLVSERAHRLGFAVEAFLGEVDLVVRPLDARLGRVADISSAALLGDGSPVLVLDVEDLVRSVLRRSREAGLGLGKVTQQGGERRRKRILVVDDSAAVRELESELLARQGYLVVQATDGVDAWSKVRENACDLVITDVDMPRMDGIALTRSVKQDPRLRSTPVMIVSYRDSEEDRARGLAAAADFYFAKSEFEGDALLQAVVNLIGEAKA